jgi:hypothetical protein
MRHESKVVNFYDPDEVQRVYYPEVAQFVKQATGAARVQVVDHNVGCGPMAKEGINGARGPVKVAHNGYTPKSGPQRERDLMGVEAEELLRHRSLRSTNGGRFADRSRNHRWPSATRRACRFPTSFRRISSTAIAPARFTLSSTARIIAGAISLRCGGTKYCFSSATIRRKMAAPLYGACRLRRSDECSRRPPGEHRNSDAGVFR